MCGSTFGGYQAKEQHMKKKHPAETLKCTDCDYIAGNREALKKHRYRTFLIAFFVTFRFPVFLFAVLIEILCFRKTFKTGCMPKIVFSKIFSLLTLLLLFFSLLCFCW